MVANFSINQVVSNAKAWAAALIAGRLRQFEQATGPRRQGGVHSLVAVDDARPRTSYVNVKPRRACALSLLDDPLNFALLPCGALH